MHDNVADVEADALQVVRIYSDVNHILRIDIGQTKSRYLMCMTCMLCWVVYWLNNHWGYYKQLQIAVNVSATVDRYISCCLYKGKANDTAHAKPKGMMNQHQRWIISHVGISRRGRWTRTPSEYVSTGLTYRDDKNHPESKGHWSSQAGRDDESTPKVDHLPRWHQSPRQMDTNSKWLRIYRPHI